MDRMKVIDHIAALVPKSVDGSDGFTVDLKHPDIVILVEVLGRTTGLSVFSHYLAFSKYNIRTLFELVFGFKQDVEKKSPEDLAAAQRAGAEKRKKAQEHKEKEKQARQAKLEKQQQQEAEQKLDAPAAVSTEAVVPSADGDVAMAQ